MDLRLKVIEKKYQMKNLDKRLRDKKRKKLLPGPLNELWLRTSVHSSKDILPEWAYETMKRIIEEFYFVINGRFAYNIFNRTQTVRHHYDRRPLFDHITLYGLVPNNMDVFRSLKRVDSGVSLNYRRQFSNMSYYKERVHTAFKIHATRFFTETDSQRDIWLVLFEIEESQLERCKKCPVAYMETCQQYLTVPKIFNYSTYRNDTNWVRAHDIKYFGVPDCHMGTITFVNLGTKSDLQGLTLVGEQCVHRYCTPSEGRSTEETDQLLYE